MTFVRMPYRRLDSQRPQHAHTAHTQHYLLLQANLGVSHVETRRQLPLLRRIFRYIGIKQIDVYAAYPHFPDSKRHRPLAKGNLHQYPSPVTSQHGSDRCFIKVQLVVVLLLGSSRRDVLTEVSLRIHEAYCYKRQSNVTRFLAHIAGQNPQATGIDGQGTVNGQFHGEVGHRAFQQIGVVRSEPRLLGRHLGIELGHYRIVESQKLRIRGQLLQPFRAGLPELFDGVVAADPPQDVVDVAKKLASINMPAPPQVVSQLLESAYPLRYSPAKALICHGHPIPIPISDSYLDCSV